MAAWWAVMYCVNHWTWNTFLLSTTVKRVKCAIYCIFLSIHLTLCVAFLMTLWSDAQHVLLVTRHQRPFLSRVSYGVASEHPKIPVTRLAHTHSSSFWPWNERDTVCGQIDFLGTAIGHRPPAIRCYWLRSVLFTSFMILTLKMLFCVSQFSIPNSLFINNKLAIFHTHIRLD